MPILLYNLRRSFCLLLNMIKKKLLAFLLGLDPPDLKTFVFPRYYTHLCHNLLVAAVLCVFCSQPPELELCCPDFRTKFRLVRVRRILGSLAVSLQKQRKLLCRTFYQPDPVTSRLSGTWEACLRACVCAEFIRDQQELTILPPEHCCGEFLEISIGPNLVKFASPAKSVFCTFHINGSEISSLLPKEHKTVST